MGKINTDCIKKEYKKRGYAIIKKTMAARALVRARVRTCVRACVRHVRDCANASV